MSQSTAKPRANALPFDSQPLQANRQGRSLKSWLEQAWRVLHLCATSKRSGRGALSVAQQRTSNAGRGEVVAHRRPPFAAGRAPRGASYATGWRSCPLRRVLGGGVQVPSRLSASPKPIVAIGPVARATRRLNHSTHGPEIQPSRATRYGTKERDSLGDYLPRAAARSRSCCGWERLRTSAIRSDRQAERCEPRGPGHYSANVKKHGTTTVIQ